PNGSMPSDGPSERKEKMLRAILRAPELVQDLYKADLLTQKDAARLGRNVEDHFRGASKMVPTGKGAFREVKLAVVRRDHLHTRHCWSAAGRLLARQPSRLS